MPVYLSNDHLITRNTSTPGEPRRKQKPDLQKKLDFKVERRHKEINKQRTDRPSQPPSSCREFISRGRACQPPHSNIPPFSGGPFHQLRYKCYWQFVPIHLPFRLQSPYDHSEESLEPTSACPHPPRGILEITSACAAQKSQKWKW